MLAKNLDWFGAGRKERSWSNENLALALCVYAYLLLIDPSCLLRCEVPSWSGCPLPLSKCNMKRKTKRKIAGFSNGHPTSAPPNERPLPGPGFGLCNASFQFLVLNVLAGVAVPR